MLVETLRADWTARGPKARVCVTPTFEGGDLLLGAGTKIADAGDDAAQMERAIALVSIAIGRPLNPSAMAHVRRALAKAREGNAPLAMTHLALAGVGQLDDPREDARRLFIADGLMKAGVTPGAIVALLDESPPDSIERAYNPDQPRVPAGSGRPSGQWTSGDSAGEAGAPNDALSPASDQGAPINRESEGVQIADDSDNWPQYLNPIG